VENLLPFPAIYTRSFYSSLGIPSPFWFSLFWMAFFSSSRFLVFASPFSAFFQLLIRFPALAEDNSSPLLVFHPKDSAHLSYWRSFRPPSYREPFFFLDREFSFSAFFYPFFKFLGLSLLDHVVEVTGTFAFCCMRGPVLSSSPLPFSLPNTGFFPFSAKISFSAALHSFFFFFFLSRDRSRSDLWQRTRLFRAPSVPVRQSPLSLTVNHPPSTDRRGRPFSLVFFIFPPGSSSILF